MASLRNILPANRVAAITTWLAGLAGLILAVEGTFPRPWQNATLGIAGLITKAVTTLKFLEGSQRSEALAATADPAADPGFGGDTSQWANAPIDIAPAPDPAPSTPVAAPAPGSQTSDTSASSSQPTVQMPVFDQQLTNRLRTQLTNAGITPSA